MATHGPKSAITMKGNEATILLAGSGDVAVSASSGMISGRFAVAIGFQRLAKNSLKVGDEVPAEVKGIGPVHRIIFLEPKSIEGLITRLQGLLEKLRANTPSGDS
jgi:hypothetical protein